MKQRLAEQSLARYHALAPEMQKARNSNLPKDDARLRRLYGIGLDDYEALLEAQGGRCAMCETPQGPKRLCVDHDHSCCPGERSCGRCIRGLLCVTCNVWLGFYENPWWGERARLYLGVRKGKYHDEPFG